MTKAYACWPDAVVGHSLVLLQCTYVLLQLCTFMFPSHTHISGVAKRVLDRCITTNATKDGSVNSRSNEYEITYDYQFLEDLKDSDTTSDPALSRMINMIADR